VIRVLLAFAPFLAFVAADRTLGPVRGLGAGTLTSLTLLIAAIARHTRFNPLELGTVLLFTGLLGATQVVDVDWSVALVRLVVDLGMAAVVGVVILLGGSIAPDRTRLATDPSSATAGARQVDRRLGAIWAGAFLALAIVDLLWLRVRFVTPVAVAAATIGIVGLALSASVVLIRTDHGTRHG
jgi:hypothetical protein